MKLNKLFAGVLAAAMMMSVGVSAMAAVQTATQPDSNGNYTNMTTVTLKKTYGKVGDNTAVSPAETFTFSEFTCTDVAETESTILNTDTRIPKPTIGSVSYVAGDAGKAESMTKEITINLPQASQYPSIGRYTYTFKEVDGNTAGVTYRSTDDITLVVTVIRQGDQKVIAAVHTEKPVDTGNATNKKSDSFDNTYSAGKLQVKKEVDGVLGSQTKNFNVKVTFTAPSGDTVKSDIAYTTNDSSKTGGTVSAGDGWTTKTVDITLHHGEIVTFTNIPEGVTYTVQETLATDDKYEASYVYSDDTNKKIDDVANTVDIVTITNKYIGSTPDTGVILDNAPYIVMLAVVAGGVVFMVSKKHREE